MREEVEIKCTQLSRNFIVKEQWQLETSGSEQVSTCKILHHIQPPGEAKDISENLGEEVRQIPTTQVDEVHSRGRRLRFPL